MGFSKEAGLTQPTEQGVEVLNQILLHLAKHSPIAGTPHSAFDLPDPVSGSRPIGRSPEMTLEMTRPEDASVLPHKRACMHAHACAHARTLMHARPQRTRSAAPTCLLV